MLIDTHAHYDDSRFDVDRNELLTEIQNSGDIKYIINVSADINGLNDSISLAQQYDFMYSSVGIHPSCVKNMNYSTVEKMEHLCKTNPKVIAVGEVGLDYHYPDTQKELQKQWFVIQIELAKKVKLPLIIHDRDAHKDILDVIKQEKASEIGGVFHCYSGSAEMLKEVIYNNFFVSVGGIVTFKNAKNIIEVVKNIPLDKLLLETDCPYLAPEPYRGCRNNSMYMKFAVNKIAEILNLHPKQVEEVTTENAEKLFKFLSGKKSLT